MAAAVFSGVFILWPLIAFLGGQGFAPLIGIAALATIPVSFPHLRPRVYPFVLLAFFLYAAASLTWSAHPFIFGEPNFLKAGLALLAGGLLIAAAASVSVDRRRLVIRIAIWGFLAQLVIMAVLTVYETEAIKLIYGNRPDDEGVQNISRNSLMMAAAAPFLIAGLTTGRSRGLAILLTLTVAAAEIAILYKRGVEAGLLSLAISALFFIIVRFAGRQGFRIIGGLIALAILTTPLWTSVLSRHADITTATTSPGYREAIWKRALVVVTEKPVTGAGVGVLRTIRERITDGVFKGQLIVPNHPHNMPLQLWAETGGIGAFLLAAAIVLASFRLPRPETIGTGGGLAAALAGSMVVMGCVSFDLWNEWWWALGGLLATLVALAPRVSAARKEKTPPRGIVFDGGGLGRLPEDASTTLVAQGLDPPPVATPAQRTSTIAVPAPTAKSVSLSNNFNLLRLVFALMVVAYHVVALSAVPAWAASEAPLSLGAEIGVQGFFVLSGYLVYASLDRSNSIGLYAQKRVRRLYPGYAAVILICAAAALAFTPEARASLVTVAKYVAANLGFANFLQPDLPGVFQTNRFPEINGALWTLKIEVMFYITLPILAWLLAKSGRYWWVLALLVYVGAEVFRIGLRGAGQIELSRQLPGQMSFFITGMALYRLRLSGGPLHIVGLVGAAALAVTFFIREAEPARAAALAAVSLWVATGWPRLPDAARFGDISYGIYIVHFPIIQTLIVLGLFASQPWLGAGAALGMALVVAFLLWHVIEKPSLRADSAYRHPKA